MRMRATHSVLKFVRGSHRPAVATVTAPRPMEGSADAGRAWSTSASGYPYRVAMPAADLDLTLVLVFASVLMLVLAVMVRGGTERNANLASQRFFLLPRRRSRAPAS